jgi:Glycosyltransferase family 87
MTARELTIVCAVAVFVFAAGVGLKASGSRWAGGDVWTAGGDLVAFYVAGRILNQYDGARLYDIELQERVHSEVVPGAAALNRTFAYPPYIAALFQPLARLPLSTALFAFMIVTPLVFLAGLLLLNARFGSTAPDERALTVLAGLSFFPFLGYTWLGAQISTIGFVAMALAVYVEDRGWPLVSGIALSLCLYKPTLVVLAGPMLLVAGRYRQLAGFAAGAGLQILLWLAIGGGASFAAFVEELQWTMARTTAAGQSFFNPYRYADVNAFFRLLPYGRSAFGRVMLGIVVAAALASLVTAWWRSRRANQPEQLLVWAATLTWTLILNVYVPLYDTVIVVPAAVLAVAAVRARGWIGWNRVGPALAFVWLAPWIAEFCARTIRVQIYTLALGAFGTLLLLEARRGAERVARPIEANNKQTPHV